MDRQLPYRTVLGRGRAGIYQLRHVAGYSRASFFKEFKLWRVNLGFVGQSSPSVALRVERPSVLNKFFFSELPYSAGFGRESRKFAGGV